MDAGGDDDGGASGAAGVRAELSADEAFVSLIASDRRVSSSLARAAEAAGGREATPAVGCWPLADCWVLLGCPPPVACPPLGPVPLPVSVRTASW